MVFPNIEKIKQEYTDKYVVVDARQPELSRFADVVGQVKTVNMSGRALVEFQDYHLNIGWYDIDLDYLKVVDKPIPQEKKKPEPKKKPAPKSPGGAAASAAAKPKPAGKPSTADILAKLKGGAGAAPKAKEGEAAAAAVKPKPKAEAKTGAADRSKMSVADMLAAARGGAAGESEAGEAASAAGESAPEPTPPKATAPPEPEPTPPAADGGIVKIDKSGMSIEEMLAYCREHDAA